MKVPLNLKDWKQFYNAAQTQGVPIQSRYIGVYVNILHTNKKKYLYWMARYQGAHKPKLLGRFPFNKAGEQAAGKAYADYVATLPEEELSNHKGRVIKSKRVFVS